MTTVVRRRPPIALLLLALAYIGWGYANKVIPISPDPMTFWLFAAGPDLLFVGVLFGAYVSRRLPTERYYLVSPQKPEQFLLDCLLCFIVFAAIVLFFRHPLSVLGDIARYMTNTSEVVPSQYEQPAYQTVAGSWNVVLMALTLVVGSISEEVVYRGMLRRLVERRALYIVGSSLLFAGIHISGGLNAVLVAFVMGVAACALLIQLRSLAPLIVGHIGVNLTVLAQR